jgi:hypothetical protein
MLHALTSLSAPLLRSSLCQQNCSSATDDTWCAPIPGRPLDTLRERLGVHHDRSGRNSTSRPLDELFARTE